MVLAALAVQGQTVDLLQRYPTELTKGDTAPDRARAWEFTAADVFQVTGFHLVVGKDFEVKAGPRMSGSGIARTAPSGQCSSPTRAGN